jgi:ankyrin repeat protein
VNKSYNIKNKFLKNIVLGSFLFSSFAGTSSQLQAAPIHGRAARGDVVGIQQLLNGGANPNQRDEHGQTPLHFANTPDVIDILCDWGADPNVANNFGYTPLHYKVRVLFEPHLNDLTRPQNNKRKIQSLLSCIKQLLRRGADKKKINNAGYSPESIVEQAFQTNVFYDGNTRYNVSSNALQACIEIRGLFPKSIYDAVADNDIIEARQLLAAGVDPNGINRFGYAPLHYATTPEMVELLCNAGANINGPDQWGNTPLHSAVAIINPNLELIRKLLQKGARIDIPNQQGETPLSKVKRTIQTGVVTYSRSHLGLITIGEDVAPQTFIRVQDLFCSFSPSRYNIQ